MSDYNQFPREAFDRWLQTDPRDVSYPTGVEDRLDAPCVHDGRRGCTVDYEVDVDEDEDGKHTSISYFVEYDNDEDPKSEWVDQYQLEFSDE